jgi:hypothetical protein
MVSRLVGELESQINPTWAPLSAIPQTVLLFTSIWYTTLRSPPE